MGERSEGLLRSRNGEGVSPSLREQRVRRARGETIGEARYYPHPMLLISQQGLLVVFSGLVGWVVAIFVWALTERYGPWRPRR